MVNSTRICNLAAEAIFSKKKDWEAGLVDPDHCFHVAFLGDNIVSQKHLKENQGPNQNFNWTRVRMWIR